MAPERGPDSRNILHHTKLVPRSCSWFKPQALLVKAPIAGRMACLLNVQTKEPLFPVSASLFSICYVPAFFLFVNFINSIFTRIPMHALFVQHLLSMPVLAQHSASIRNVLLRLSTNRVGCGMIYICILHASLEQRGCLPAWSTRTRKVPIHISQTVAGKL